MCKIISPIFFMITIMIMVPAPVESTSNEIVFYGAAEIIKYDENGNVVYTQIIHNQLVDTGEEFLLDQVFHDGATTIDAEQIGVICISNDTSFTVAETETAALFDTGNTITDANCKEDSTGDVVTTGGTAVIGPLTFAAGGANIANDDTITGIAICQADTSDDNDHVDCATEGIMFAVVNTSDVTLASGETVDITYTFDITSSGT